MEEKTAVYLIMVSDQNNNKYYNLENNGNGTFTAKWGRVEGHESSKIYPISKWQSTINSKLKKGYKDVTHLMAEVIEDSKVENISSENADKFSSITIESIKEVIKRLYNYANQVVESSYKVKSSVVTQAMVDEAQKLIDLLANNKDSFTVEEFNKTLLELFTVIPRSMRDTRDYIAYKTDDFNQIIQREQDTLDSLAGMVYVPKSQQKDEGIKQPEEQKSEENILQEMGIEMEETSLEEDEMLKKLMGDSGDKFYKAWRVCNKEAEEKYQDFIQKHNITKSKLLCHGSRNANWFNILKLSLMIRPSNAIYTGSLLGDALYMSNPENYHGGVIKSIRYSSLNGYWSREYQNCGFIAFFEVATGDSYDIYSFDSKYHTYNLEKLQKDCPGAWSLHLHGIGHGGVSTVINDEITVYNKEQVSIRYLVEIR